MPCSSRPLLTELDKEVIMDLIIFLFFYLGSVPKEE